MENKNILEAVYTFYDELTYLKKIYITFMLTALMYLYNNQDDRLL